MMENASTAIKLSFSLALALFFWTLIFGVQLISFWVGMALATSILAALSIYWEGWPLSKKELTTSSIILGLFAAALLYGLFFIANHLAILWFSFAKEQVSTIHMIRYESSPVAIALILFFITSPCEEIFWRGFIQKKLMQKYTPAPGWILGALFYAGVHLVSGNFMLTMAALVAGLFWGFLYWKTQNLWSCILSHAIWTISIFILWPIGR